MTHGLKNREITMTDKFFTQTHCDRCSESLEGKSRKMSWFTEDCLCEICIKKELELRSKLNNKGVDVAALEGCGKVPEGV